MKTVDDVQFHLPTSMHEFLIDRAKALPMDILWGLGAVACAIALSYFFKAMIL